jgi:hypothetical protein
MVDVVGEGLYYAAFPVAPVVLALVVWRLRVAWLPLRLAAAASLAASSFLLLISFSFAMGLRDGMGPDGTVHTEGLTAVRKSLAELTSTYLGPLLIAAALAVAGLVIALLSRRGRNVDGVSVG